MPSRLPIAVKTGTGNALLSMSPDPRNPSSGKYDPNKRTPFDNAGLSIAHCSRMIPPKLCPARKTLAVEDPDSLNKLKLVKQIYKMIEALLSFLKAIIDDTLDFKRVRDVAEPLVRDRGPQLGREQVLDLPDQRDVGISPDLLPGNENKAKLVAI